MGLIKAYWPSKQCHMAKDTVWFRQALRHSRMIDSNSYLCNIHDTLYGRFAFVSLWLLSRQSNQFPRIKSRIDSSRHHSQVMKRTSLCWWIGFVKAPDHARTECWWSHLMCTMVMDWHSWGCLVDFDMSLVLPSHSISMVILLSDLSDIIEVDQVTIIEGVCGMSWGTIHDATIVHPQGWMASHFGIWDHPSHMESRYQHGMSDVSHTPLAKVGSRSKWQSMMVSLPSSKAEFMSACWVEAMLWDHLHTQCWE